MSTNDSSPPFLFLLRSQVDAPEPTPEEMQQTMQKWMAWIERLSGQGIYLGGDRLQDLPGQVLRSTRAMNDSDGPFIETKEVVGGYMLVKAPDLASAVKIARDCPGLDNGWTVEVRLLYPRPA